LLRLRPLLAAGLINMLVIDPLTAYLGNRDSYKDAEVRKLLAPLAKLAEETGVAVVAVMHLNKKQDQKALYRAGGSIAFVAAARIVLAVAADPDDQIRRLLMPIKANVTGQSSALAFCIEDGRLRWEGKVELDAEQVLSAGAPTGPRPAVKLQAATTFLRDQLARGPRPVSSLKEAAKGHHAWPTVERAKTDLGVLVTSRPGGGWLWSLP